MFRFISSHLPTKFVDGLTAVYFRTQYLQNVGSGRHHSHQAIQSYPNMKIQILPALSDNYMYLLIDEKSNEAAVVDPVTPEVVMKAVAEAKVNLTTVITTHHHWDHAGGNEKLVKDFGSPLRVFGGDDRIGALTHKIGDGDTIEIGGLHIKCLFTPCHTTGHICYYVTGEPGTRAAVFTGDCLFLGGCGRFFEGTAEQMHEALVTKLSALPDATDVYCGHEYALQNLAYSVFVQPDNEDAKLKLKAIGERRERGEPSVPSTMAEEKSYNPFMRVEEASLQQRYGTSGGVATMKAVRLEKDNWKA